MKVNGSLVFDASSASELKNLRIEKLAGGSVPTFGAADSGRLIFVTAEGGGYLAGTIYYGHPVNGWVAIATGGNAAALQQEVDNIEASLGAGVNPNDGTFNAAAFPTTAALNAPASFTDAINQIAAYATANDTLAELDDVTLTAPADGQYLKYNSGSSTWVNDTLTLSDVTDVTVPVAELNLLQGLTATALELNILDGVTSTSAADISSIAGYAGANVSATEFGYVDGVTSPIQAQIDSKQAGDADLTALSALLGTGIAVRTAADTWTLRSTVAPAAGITITNADGVAGDVTFALANDLAALEGLSTFGYVVRTADGAATTRSIGGQAGRVVVTNGDGIASNTDIDLAEVANSGTGTFLKLTTDAYGRVTGTQAVAEADITGLVDSVYVNVTGDTMTGDLVMGTNFVVMSNQPTSDNHAANKAYVDAVAAGLSWKQAVNAATTGPITLSGVQTIDGVSVQAGDRVLVKDQADPAENGIYVAAAGAWTRSTNMDQAGEFLGATVFVLDGTANDNTGWTQTNSVAAVGTDPVVWSQFSGGQLYTWGTGLSASGNTINVNLGSGIFEQGADAIGIELHNPTAGAIILTDDGTGRSVSDTSKLHLLLKAAGGLTQDADGLYVPAAGITNAMLLNSTIGINGDAGTFSRALGETLILAGTAVQGVSTDASVAGTVTISVADASSTQKGVASFTATEFVVTNGNVAVGVIQNSNLANSSISFAGTTGGAQAVALGGTLSVVGGTAPITTESTAGTVTINVADATTGAKGLASFNGDQFAVVAGAVSLAATLDDLLNVTGADAAAEGSLLTKNATGEYVPVSRADVAGSTSVGDLGDVTVSAAAGGHTLVYSQATSQWVNRKVFHTEAKTSSTTWTVNHSLGQKFCNVTVADADSEVVIPQSITFVDENQLVVTFNTAIAGQVMVSGVNAA